MNGILTGPDGLEVLRDAEMRDFLEVKQVQEAFEKGVFKNLAAKQSDHEEKVGWV